MATADNRLMTDATGQGILTALQNLAAVQAVPYVASIPTGQWSGSGNDWYITINASNVTANSILIPNYDKDSSELLNGPVWCVPAAGSFTIHTSAIPAGTVTIMVMFAGTMGEAQYQVLDDVYSKDQIDALVAQNTASKFVGRTPYTPTISCASPGFAYNNAAFLYSRAGNLLFISGRLNITNIGTAASTHSFEISLPSGYTCSDFVGSIGSIVVNKNGVDVSKLSIRQTNNNTIYVQSGAGGIDSLNIIGTGYVMLYAIVMLNE